MTVLKSASYSINYEKLPSDRDEHAFISWINSTSKSANFRIKQISMTPVNTSLNSMIYVLSEIKVFGY